MALPYPRVVTNSKLRPLLHVPVGNLAVADYASSHFPSRVCKAQISFPPWSLRLQWSERRRPRTAWQRSLSIHLNPLSLAQDTAAPFVQ